MYYEGLFLYKVQMRITGKVDKREGGVAIT